jgi:Na+-transporting NADH:ubiquinone oxidoreductase subunit C
MSRDSIGHTFKVALMLCVVCSVLVSGAAVILRKPQQINRERDRKSNILSAAGLGEGLRGSEIEKLYEERVIERLIELDSGEFAPEMEAGEFDQRRAIRDSELSQRLSQQEDPARVRRREKYSYIYLIKDESGEKVDQLVLPIRGYGLWSTLWGFMSLDAQSISEGPAAIMIRGLTYYEHGETPGLGGEVDNPRWKAQWRDDKRLYDDEWNVRMQVAKGTVSSDDPQVDFRVDGLSGATITANGVTNMLEFWFGEKGFQPFLQNAYEQPDLLSAEGGNDG